jgi:hypothetical protein
LQEFIFDGLGIPSNKRSEARREDLHLGNTANAYGLFQHNCQHFSQLLMDKMYFNGWSSFNRLNQEFSLRQLSEDWISSDNPWIWRTSEMNKYRYRNIDEAGGNFAVWEREYYNYQPAWKEKLWFRD